MRVEIANTTLCCIDCATHELARRALAASLGECRFQHALFLTDRPMRIEGVEVRAIDPITAGAEYSTFVLTRLAQHVETDFVLLIQWDGYVLSGQAWLPEFQNYDYIGARWPHVPGVEVGNGGFSLRSRRLLQAGTTPGFVIGHPEDAAICIVNRALLQDRLGIRFAPGRLADRFSFERSKEPGQQFGFHGLFNMPDILRADELPSFLAAWTPRIAQMPEVLEFIYHYYSLGRMDEARMSWRRATQLSSVDELQSFLRMRMTPLAVAEAMIKALS
ncbi:MAG: hypothetical protein HYR63_23425 [Proteobacteria bacterium]|nr:hypothetical protein [Pseudomonadota bacterium]